MSIWSKVLDNCPGLLCCVVNLQGKLIYATHGYKVVAARIFGHQCEEGGTYPPLITELDKILHGALTSAGLGKIDAFEVAGQPKNWEVVTSPLRIEPDKIAGVVIKLLQVDRQDAENTSAPVIISNPDILEAVPFRAGVVDTHGMFLAANKYLASCVRSELQGKNIFELIKPEVEADVVNIILRRTGIFECLMYDINTSENFYDEVAMTYLDDELNDEKIAELNDYHEETKSLFRYYYMDIPLETCMQLEEFNNQYVAKLLGPKWHEHLFSVYAEFRDSADNEAKSGEEVKAEFKKQALEAFYDAMDYIFRDDFGTSSQTAKKVVTNLKEMLFGAE